MRTRDEPARRPNGIARRTLLRGAFTVTGGLGLGLFPRSLLAGQRAGRGTGAPVSDSTLTLARFLSRTRYPDLPPQAIEHAKMILASTFASAAPGSLIDSARILAGLAKQRGGTPESTVWFDGVKLPVAAAARVNAAQSDASASDDSDIRNTAHYGTVLTSVGLAVAERTGASGQDLLAAMILGYEAAGRIGDARSNGRSGLHASQLVAFGGAIAAAKLLGLGDAPMAHALGLVAVSMGGLAIGTNSWAREFMAANAASSAVEAAQAAARGYTVNEDMLGTRDGFVDVFGGGREAVPLLTADLGSNWNITKYLAIKLWPGAHPFSGTVEAAVNASRQANVAPAEIAKILVAGPGRTTVAGSRRPRDLVEAIHSLPYFVASGVADKEFTWIHATEGKVFNPVVERLMGLVEIDPAPPAVKYDWNWSGTVTVVTTDGRKFTSTVEAPRGSGPRGIQWTDVDAKYRALMPDSKLAAARIDQLLDLIHGFDRVPNVSAFMSLLASRG